MVPVDELQALRNAARQPPTEDVEDEDHQVLAFSFVSFDWDVTLPFYPLRLRCGLHLLSFNESIIFCSYLFFHSV